MFLNVTFFYLTDDLRSLHFTIFLKYASIACFLLSLFDRNMTDRIQNKQCMINCHGTSIIYDKKNVQTINLTIFLVNNKKAFILYDGLQALRRTNSSKVN